MLLSGLLTIKLDVYMDPSFPKKKQFRGKSGNFTIVIILHPRGIQTQTKYDIIVTN